MQFNNPTEYNGLVQRYEAETGAEYGDVSGNTKRLKEFTALCNSALDRYSDIVDQVTGTWERDDSNHTDDHNVIYATLTSGQSKYSFIYDQNGNVIKDIYKVLVLPSSTATRYQEVYPVDENQSENIDIIDESNVSGTPTKYGKRGNTLRFNTVPNYTVARGVKVLINRSSSYYTYTDISRRPGYPYFQEYFFLKPAYEKTRTKDTERHQSIEKEIIKLEGDLSSGKLGLIAKAYGNRKKVEVTEISGEYINSV